MTKDKQLFSKQSTQDIDVIVTVERIKMKRNLFRVIAYKLANDETAITTRQMAIAVKKPLYTAQEFIRKMKIEPVLVQMPNRSITDMVSVSIVLDFWAYLNESSQGNLLTKIGQQYLTEYLEE